MGSRPAGPLDQNRQSITIDEGTLVLTRSQPAGTVCATADPNLLDRANNLRLALEMAQSKAGEAIARHTGDEFRMLVSSLIPGLLLALGGLLTTTAIGGAIGAFFGGVGAAPGAAIGFEVGLLLLNYLGLGFLAYYVIERIDQVMDAFGRGIRIAWNSCGDRDSLTAAATEFAEGVGIFFRLVLQALVLYVLKAAGEGKFTDALNKLSESKLFKSVPALRQWLATNYQRLATRFGMINRLEQAAEFIPPIQRHTHTTWSTIQAHWRAWIRSRPCAVQRLRRSSVANTTKSYCHSPRSSIALNPVARRSSLRRAQVNCPRASVHSFLRNLRPVQPSRASIQRSNTSGPE